MSGTDEHCLLCEVADVSADHAPIGATDLVVAYVDDELVALIEADLPGVLLAPRVHVNGLARMAGTAGVFLGALRRAVTVVRSAYGASGAMIEPTTALAGARSHVCYHVVPTEPIDGERSHLLSTLDRATVGEYLAEALGERFVAG